jgi:hypothetical protein
VTDEQTVRQTYRMIGVERDRQAGRQAGRQTKILYIRLSFSVLRRTSNISRIVVLMKIQVLCYMKPCKLVGS